MKLTTFISKISRKFCWNQGFVTEEEAEFRGKRLASYRAEVRALRRERDQLSLGIIHKI
jgi:hypothetical protein